MIDGSVMPTRVHARRAAAEAVARGFGLAALCLLALPLVPGRAQAAPPSGAASSAPRGTAAPAQRAPDAAASRPPSAGEADVGTRSVAARARMSECGHQWNNLKRTGAATGTWKEFSRSCLAQK